jgi:thiol-disulfide isomerase/thioredoxin
MKTTLTVLVMMSLAADQYIGRLRPGLVPTRLPIVYVKLTSLTPDERQHLPQPVSDGDRAFGGKLNWAFPRKDGSVRRPGEGIRVVLIETASGNRFLYCDANGDDALTAEERFVFEHPAANGTGELEAVVGLETTTGTYRRYPFIAGIVTQAGAAAGSGEERTLSVTVRTVAEALVNIRGRQTLVQFGVDPLEGIVKPRDTWLGIDGNGDGKVDPASGSSECAMASDEDVVFRAGNRYVSVKSVDNSTGKVVLVERRASDYIRIEMRPGAVVPDFSFTDFVGAHRSLSQFRGKYVLLDFWGTWCGPCVAEIPHLKTAYESFRARGLEIIGIDGELPDTTPEQRAKGLEKARKFVADKGMTWTNATTESVRDLYQARFRVTSWPTILLLDPHLRIVSAGGKEMPLRGEELLKTLEKVLPASGPPAYLRGDDREPEASCATTPRR